MYNGTNHQKGNVLLKDVVISHKVIFPIAVCTDIGGNVCNIHYYLVFLLFVSLLS